MRTASAAVLLSFLIVFQSSFAVVKRVPQDFAKIQLAVNAAGNGDTVLVAEGTYFENLVINKKILLGSLFMMDGDTSHIRKTIIDGSTPSHPDSGSCILILSETDTNMVINGVTLQKGTGTRGTYRGVVWRCGGAVFIYAGGATIVHNIIRDNDCSETTLNAGSALDIWPDPTYTKGPKEWVIAYNTIIDNNRAANVSGLAGEGGGVVLMGHGKFFSNEVRNNSSSGAVFGIGGGLLIFSDVGETDIEVRNNLIVNNTASTYAGGISCAPTAPFKIRAVFLNNIITGNTAAQNAAFRIGLGDYTFINNTITGNTSPNTNAIWFTSASGSYSYKFMNNIIWNPSCPVEFNSTNRVTAAYNCVKGGLAGTGNISSDPLFVANDSLHHLSNSSPCIGTGISFATVGSVPLNAPSKDYSGSSRPNPSWSKPDLGAMESAQAFPGVPHAYNVPQDFAKIQNAINASVNGDVVLVSEGTYKENLFINKKITLASLFFQDKDTSHISKTIIDGSTPVHPDSGSVISIRNVDTTLVITGFTITKGSGNKHVNPYWNPSATALTCGGIEMNGGGMTIRNNIITGNSINILPPATEGWGGGIGVYDIDVPGSTTYTIIESNVISNNSIIGGTQNGGGGIDMIGSGRVINNKILGNSSMYSVNAVGQSLSFKNDTAVVENNLIQGNSASEISGFAVGGSGMTAYIRNNVITDNIVSTDLSVVCWVGDNCNTVFERNYIARNTALRQYGIFVERGATSLIRNNIIVNNSGGILVGAPSAATIVNNTIADNSRYGITGSGPVSMLNNILWNNTLGNLFGSGSRFSAYNLIGGGPLGAGDIDANPGFVANDTLYRLSDTSPCIGAGISSSTLNGVLVTAPLLDFLNTSRPRAADSKPDMGAVENNRSTPITSVNDIEELPISFGLDQNYPNPFNPSTTIRYSIPLNPPLQGGHDATASRGIHVNLTIHDILGREVATLVNEKQSAGWKEVNWNAASVSSGIYFYKLSTGNFIETKKMMVIK